MQLEERFVGSAAACADKDNLSELQFPCEGQEMFTLRFLELEGTKYM